MSKLGFRFAAVPKDRHPEWFEVSLLARTIGMELFVTIYDEKARAAEVAVAENWTVSLCRLMRVEAKDRLAACRALEALERHGLIVIADGKARVVFRIHDEVKQEASSPQELPKEPSREVQEVVKRSPTPGNDSGQLLQKEEIDKKEQREYARAREGDHWVRPPEQSSLSTEFTKRFEQATQTQPISLQVSRMSSTVSRWVSTTAGLRKLSEDVVAKQLLDGFFSSDSAREAGFPPSYLGANPLEYFDRKRVKSVVRSRFAGPSRVPTAEEYAQDAKEKAPWEM